VNVRDDSLTRECSSSGSLGDGAIGDLQPAVDDRERLAQLRLGDAQRDDRKY
jgi:hypothetical protein